MVFLTFLAIITLFFVGKSEDEGEDY